MNAHRSFEEFQNRITEILSTHYRCPAELNTRCPLWAHLLACAESTRECVLGSSKDKRLTRLITNAFVNHLAIRLDLIARQTLLLEKAVLERQSSAEHPIRYEDFVSVLIENTSRLVDVHAAYPELNRIAAVHAYDFFVYCKDFSRHLIEDVGKWSEILGYEVRLDEISRIELSHGETHCGHRVVITVYADDRALCGYKPRDLRFEMAITEFLRSIAEQSGDEELSGWALPHYLCQDGYGWVEWLPQKPANKIKDVARYYYRAGFLLAFSTFFSITDLHSGNIVAHGDSPVPVDLEAGLAHVKRREFSGRALSEELQWNCISTGLLPNWTWKGADMVGVDLSGLGGLDAQYCSAPVYQNTNKGSDAESFAEQGVYLQPADNIVHLDGERQAPYDHESLILKGFRKGYLEIKRRFACVETFIENVSTLETRFIARTTVGYHYAVQCSLHPKYMMNTAERAQFLRACLTNETAIDPVLLEAEIAAAINCEIPRVSTTPGRATIWEAQYGGNTTLPSDRYFVGTEAALQYFQAADAKRIKFEEKLIQGTLISLRTVHDKAYGPDKMRHRLLVEETETFDHGHVRNAIEQTGSYLIDFVREEAERGFGWYGFKISPGNSMEYGVLGDDQYCGITGILYALLHLARSGSFAAREFEELLRRYAAHLARQYEKEQPKLGGAYVGAASCFVPMTLMLREVAPDLGACPSSRWSSWGESDSLRGYEQGFSTLED